MTDDINELRARHAELTNQIRKHDNQERMADNNAMIGKCFKYRNCYTQDDPWWLYSIVTHTDGWWPKAFSFQKKSDGEFSIEEDRIFQSRDGWVEVEPQEFWSEWDKFHKELTDKALSIISHTSAPHPEPSEADK